MPLDFQIVQAPMRFGLAEGVDPHQVPFGTLVTAENVGWGKTGLLEKRPGTVTVGTVTSGAAKRLIVRGTELAATDGETLYSYAAGSWVSRGRHSEIGLTWSTLQDSIAGARSSDIAYLSDGRVVHAWVQGDPTDTTNAGNVYYQIVDLATGAVTVAPTLLESSSGTRVRVISSGVTWAILWVKDVNLKAFTGSLTTTLRTDVYNGAAKLARQPFDAVVIGSDFVVAYALAAGIELVRFSLAATPVQAAAVAMAGTASTSITSISVDGAAGETLYVGFLDTQPAVDKTFYIAGADPSTLAQTLAPTAVSIATSFATYGVVSVSRKDATSCNYCWSYAGAGTRTGRFNCASITDAGVITAGRDMTFAALLSRPFAIGSRFYALVATFTHASAFQVANGAISGSDTFLVDVTADGSTDPPRLVGKTDLLIGGIWATGFVSTPVAVSATRRLIVAPFQAAVTSNVRGWKTGLRQGLRLLEATTSSDAPADLWRSVSIGQETYPVGGVLSAYDGMEVVPYGWAHAAYIDPTQTVTGGGGSMAAGTYTYNVVPERRSNVGILHRGPTGVAISESPLAGGSVELWFAPPSLNYSSANKGIIAVYRTVVDGTVLQRLTVEPQEQVVYNNAGTPFTLTDTKADADIGSYGFGIALSTQPALYTEGGELDDYQPPASTTIALHQRRLWVVAGDERTVWFSKDSTSNPEIAPGFHPTMTLLFERAITALAPMDEKLIAFAADTFWYVVGEGPALNGQGASYTVAPVQTDVGCTSPRSIVSTPDGLLFLSTRGIYLLTRSLELVWIGRQVKDQLASFPNVTSAVLVASRNEVRFTANDAAGTAGITLVYNYVEKQWTTWRHTVSGVYGAPIADAVMWNGVWTFVTPAGVVVQESAATWLDGSTWVPVTIETAWINAGGPLAFQSVRRFTLEGVSNTNHDLTLSVGFDSSTSYPQTKTFTAGSSVTSIGPFEACWITIGTRRKCQAIRFKIQDATPTNPGTYPVGTGRGPSIDMLGIEVGSKKGLAVQNATHMG